MRKKKNLKTWIIILLLFVLFGIIAGLYLKNYSKDLDIPDRCGLFVNKVVHTVDSESVCEVRCMSQCETSNYKMTSYKFTQAEIGCHTCTCKCIKRLF